MISLRTRPIDRVVENLPALGIIGGVVGLAFVAGMAPLLLGSIQLGSILLLAALGGTAFLVAVIYRIEYGIILLPVVATAVPVTIGTGSGSPIVASLLCAFCLIALWVVRMFIARDLTLLASPVTFPVLALTLTAVLATLYGNAERNPLVWVPPTWTRIQAGGLGVFAASAGVMLVAMNSIREWCWIRWLVWGVLGVGALSIFWYYARSQNDLSAFALGGLFSLWVIVLALGQALFNSSLAARVRIVLVVLAGAWLYRRFFLEIDWLSGWVPAAAAILTMSLLRSRKLFLLAALATIVAGGLRYDEIFDTQVEGKDSGGNLLRLDLWQQNLEITRDHLLLGTGVAGYAVYYGTFFPERALSTHSNYIDIFAQTGLVGSIFFVWLLAALFRAGFHARSQWRSGFASGFVNAGLAGLVGVVVAMALGDWLIPFVYNQTIAGFRYTVHSWLLLGALAGVKRIGSQNERSRHD